jgi:hypothetical protein
MLSRRLVHTPLCILPPTSCWNGPSTLKGKGSSHVSCALWASCTDWSNREGRLLCLPTAVMKPWCSARFRLRKTPEPQKLPHATNGPQAIKLAGRPVDCLGLTKRWSLYVASHGNSRVWDRRTACHSTRRSPARPKQDPHPYSPVSVRAVASGAGFKQAASKAPLRATSPKSQPPHLVLDSHNNYH